MKQINWYKERKGKMIVWPLWNKVFKEKADVIQDQPLIESTCEICKIFAIAANLLQL